MKYLKNHPFAVEAFFERSTVLTFAVAKGELESLIPAKFELDTYQDQYAFIAVAMVQATDLRPKGLPKFIGNDFFLVGYRIFVRYVNKEGRKMRGLYILKTETDKKKMALLGNIFTNYKYSISDITISDSSEITEYTSEKSQLNIIVNKSLNEVVLPINSPFDSWKSARRFAGPMPYTFSYEKNDNSVLIVKGVRQNWQPVPIEINRWKIDFLDQLELGNVVLANAFKIENVPYHWEKGYIEKWN